MRELCDNCLKDVAEDPCCYDGDNNTIFCEECGEQLLYYNEEVKGFIERGIGINEAEIFTCRPIYQEEDYDVLEPDWDGYNDDRKMGI